MHGIEFDEDYPMEDTPQKRRLNYLIKEYRRTEETRTRRAAFDAESTGTLSLRVFVRVVVRRT